MSKGETGVVVDQEGAIDGLEDAVSAAAPIDPPGGEFAWLRRRLDDHEQALRRQTQQIRDMGEGVMQWARTEKRRQTWANLNSFVAYLLFTLLLGFGAYVLFHSRMASVLSERDSLRRERDAARTRIAELQDQETARQSAGETALAFYNLVKDNKRADIVAKYRGLPMASLTLAEKAMFDAAYRESQAAIIDSGLSSAIAAYRSNNVAGAISDLTRLLETNPDAAHTAQIRYYLGLARMKSGQAGDAIAELAKAIEAGAERAGLTDVLFQYATALEGAGQLADAKAQYDAFVGAHPTHPLSWPARRKIRALERGLVVTDASAGRPKAPAPTATPAPDAAAPTPASRPWLPQINSKQNEPR